MTNYIFTDEHAVVTYDRKEGAKVFDNERLAYVVEETFEGIPGFSIYNAQGEHLGHMDTRDNAFAAAFQHDIHALSLH